MDTTIDEGEDAEFAWKLWSLKWAAPGAGEHTITSRAIDTEGHIQPAQDDPWITGKRTYWESNGQLTRRVRVASLSVVQTEGAASDYPRWRGRFSHTAQDAELA